MSNSINIILSRFLNSKTIVNGLPSVAYTDEEFWKKECDTVFKENWVFTGFVHGKHASKKSLALGKHLGGWV